MRRLAWPILLINADLCPKTQPALGWRVGNADTIESLARGLKPKHIEALGWTEEPQILSIAPKSPAEEAGLKPGERVIGIDGTSVDDMAKLGEAIAKRLDNVEPEETIMVNVQRDGEELAFEVAPQRACAVRVVSSSSGAINATARFKTLTVYAGLVRALPEDNDLSFVIAHELAHIAGQHPRKVTRNSAASGAVIWGPPLMALATAADWLTSYPADKLGAKTPPFTTASTRAIASTVKSVDFEREADYVGLYMLVRAGGHMEGLDNVFQVFANVSPRTTWLKVTHPMVPERLVHLEQAVAEIEAKQSNGEPLVPEGWAVHDHETAPETE